MIIRGFSGRDEVVKRLAVLAPTHVRVESLCEVNQAEWDLLVTDQRLDETPPPTSIARRVEVEPHVFVVYQAEPRVDRVVEDSSRWRTSIVRHTNHIRRELRRPENVPARAQALVDQLEVVLRARQSHEYFASDPEVWGSRSGVPDLREATPSIEPFAETADAVVLAGRYNRSESAEAWLLPSDVPDLVPWVSAALAEWHARDPQRFPGSPEWSREPSWATNRERALLAKIAEIQNERRTTLDRLAADEQRLTVELAAEREATDAYERALLTTGDAPLVAAVLRALRELGFVVTDADADPEEREHLEDLRVEDPDAPGWIALVEVKGYTKGAQTGALTQFIRFERRYRARTGRDPNALWYVANQFKDRDPGSRQLILQGNEADIAGFAESGGLVLDTVILFHLLNAVRCGAIAAGDARHMLRDATGRFAWPLAEE